LSRGGRCSARTCTPRAYFLDSTVRQVPIVVRTFWSTAHDQFKREYSGQVGLPPSDLPGDVQTSTALRNGCAERELRFDRPSHKRCPWRKPWKNARETSFVVPKGADVDVVCVAQLVLGGRHGSKLL
jgi:hypothetical protein